MKFTFAYPNVKKKIPTPVVISVHGMKVVLPWPVLQLAVHNKMINGITPKQTTLNGESNICFSGRVCGLDRGYF